MRSYELVLVLRAGVSETDKKKVLDEVTKILGGAETETTEWGKRTLAYPIKKEGEGLFILMNISYPNGSSIPEGVEKKLLINENILRHLLIRTKDKKEVTAKTKVRRRKIVNKES